MLGHAQDAQARVARDHGEALTPIADVLAHVLRDRRPLETVELPLLEALGCVLAEDVLAPFPLPPFDCSAMDGFALRSADTAGAPVELRVVAATMAGGAPAGEVGPGEAVRIMTGAPLPPGADAVVMIELTAATEHGVVISSPALAGQYVRPAGDDVRAGDLALRRGAELRPAALGVAASVGRSAVQVVRRPRVGVLSSGDELVPVRTGRGDAGRGAGAGATGARAPGTLGAGQIHDSNGVGCCAAVQLAGAIPVPLGVVADDEERVVDSLSAAAKRCDAVITTGGVSVGDRDVVKSAIARLAGDSARWFQVAVKPAKPFAFGELPGGVPVFGLPGNPVSALVSFELFVRPALRQMAGHAGVLRPVLRATAGEALRRKRDGKVHLVRVALRPGAGGRLCLYSAGEQGSHQLSVMSGADALAVLPDGEGVEAGSEVEAVLLDDSSLPLAAGSAAWWVGDGAAAAVAAAPPEPVS